MYDKTAEDVAKHFGITSRTVSAWAQKGYPIQINGTITQIKLIGSCKVGAKNWRFNLKAVINFIENLSDEKWVSLNVNTKSKMVRQQRLKTGLANSSSIQNDSAKQLKDLISSQKKRQKNSAL